MNENSSDDSFENQLPQNLENEANLANQLGVTPISVDDETVNRSV